MNKNEIYETVVGMYGPARNGKVKNEFYKNRECARLNRKIYNARLALALQKKAAFENRYMLEIIDSYEEIIKIVALKMYKYGKHARGGKL